MNKNQIQIKEIEDPQPHEISTTNDSDFRTVTKFLWFPKTIDGETKWLVTASWQEQFVEEIYYKQPIDPIIDLECQDCVIWVWKPVKWL